MTNFDLMQLSEIEGMAKLMEIASNDVCSVCPKGTGCVTDGCQNAFINWLESEVVE